MSQNLNINGNAIRIYHLIVILWVNRKSLIMVFFRYIDVYYVCSKYMDLFCWRSELTSGVIYNYSKHSGIVCGNVYTTNYAVSTKKYCDLSLGELSESHRFYCKMHEIRNQWDMWHIVCDLFITCYPFIHSFPPQNIRIQGIAPPSHNHTCFCLYKNSSYAIRQEHINFIFSLKENQMYAENIILNTFHSSTDYEDWPDTKLNDEAKSEETLKHVPNMAFHGAWTA